MGIYRIGSFRPVGFEFRLPVRLSQLSLSRVGRGRAGQDVTNVLPVVDYAFGSDDAFLVDQESERGGEDLVALRDAKAVLGEHREARPGFLGPPSRCFELAVVNDHDLAVVATAQAVQLWNYLLAGGTPRLREVQQHLVPGK